MTPHLPHAADGGSRSQFRLLLADDSPESQALIRLFLEGSACELHAVANGEAAVAFFQSQPFDLVLIDQHMPVMDGFTATRLMRAWECSRQRSSAPILVMTANSSPDSKALSQAAGCTGLLLKPLTRKLLAETFRTYCPPSSHQSAPAQPAPSTGLAAVIDEELARRRPLFLDHRREDLTRLQDAIERGDSEFVRTLGHRIKGLAGSYGFPDIGLAGAQLELAARDRDLAAMRRIVDQLATILSRAEQAA